MVNAQLRRIAASTSGSSAAEFALILPVLMLMLFGTLQVSLLMYSYNAMAGAARDATRAMAVCTVTDAGAAAAQAKANLPAWVKADDWDIDVKIGSDVSMTIKVDPAKAAIIAYLPFMPDKLTTTVLMRKEPLAAGGGSCSSPG